MPPNLSRNLIPRPYIRKICDRLCPIAAYLDARWLELCAREVSFRAVSLAPRPAAYLAKHEHYKRFKGVHYYNIMLRKDGEEIDGAIQNPSDKLRKAVLTWCTCDHAVMVCWRYLDRELRKIPGFVKLESKRSRVVPHIILFGGADLENPGKERVFEHNYIIMTFRHDIRFVLDLTGYQCGFPRVLYTLEEYQCIVLRRKENGVVVDVWGEMREDENRAMGLDDDGEEVEIAEEEREASLKRPRFAFEL